MRTGWGPEGDKRWDMQAREIGVSRWEKAGTVVLGSESNQLAF